MRILLFGAGGKVGAVLGPRLEQAGHTVTAVNHAGVPQYEGQDAAIDFTRPDAVRANVEGALGAGVPCIVGTTGLGPEDIAALDSVARERGIACFVAPNFAVGAVLMMRFAAEASKHLDKAEIVELHHDRKLDKPSGTAARTAELMEGEVPIHSVRLPGLVAHQEVILGDVGQTLTIRHDSMDRTSFMPGVLLAIRRVADLPESPTIGLEHLL